MKGKIHRCKNKEPNNVNHKIKKKKILDRLNTVDFLSGLLSDAVSVCTE